MRPDVVTASIEGLAGLSERDLIRIARRGGTGSAPIPGECLVHLARAATKDGRRALFEAAWTTVERRVGRMLRADPGGGIVPLSDAVVRDGVLDRLREMMAVDAVGYCEGLDYYEVRFGSALSNAVKDVRRSVRRETALRHPFEDDDGALHPRVERAVEEAGRTGGCDAEHGYRMAVLRDVLPSLSDLQRRIVELLLEGLPIASGDAATTTVSGELRRSERSVRDHRDAAFRRIRRVYERGGGGGRPDCCRSRTPSARNAASGRGVSHTTAAS